MDRLHRLFQGQGGAGPPSDSPQVDTSEQIYISSLALLKMLKHGMYLVLPLILILITCSASPPFSVVVFLDEPGKHGLQPEWMVRPGRNISPNIWGGVLQDSGL